MSKILKASVRVVAAHTELPTVETDVQTDAGLFRAALPTSEKRSEQQVNLMAETIRQQIIPNLVNKSLLDDRAGLFDKYPREYSWTLQNCLLQAEAAYNMTSFISYVHKLSGRARPIRVPRLVVPVVGGELFSVKEYQLIQSAQCTIQEFVNGVKLIR